MKKILIIGAFVIAIVYVLIGILFFFFQKRMIFIPSRCSDPPPGGLDIREVYFPSGDKHVLHAWWMPVPSAEYTLLFFHGNAGCVPRSEDRMRFFRELGYHVLAVDYRGYGKSSGTIDKEDDMYEDGRSSIQYVTDSLGIPPEKLIVWGWSLGGGVAVDVCRGLDIKAVVLEGTFHSLGEMAQINYPIFPTGWFLRYHFRSGEKIPDVKAPLFFIHSVDDKTIPYAQGRKLFDAATGRKMFLDISGHHVTGVLENTEKIKAALNGFLSGQSRTE